MRAALSALFTTPDGMSFVVSCSIKAALLLAASWVGAALLRRSTAAARHQIWTLGVVGALVLPVLCWILPSLLPAAAAPSLAGRITLGIPALSATSGTATITAPTWPTWLALAWAAGTLIVSLRLVRGHLAARRLARTAVPSTSASWDTALRDASTALGTGRRIPLLRSETISSPMTIGLVRPRVLLPAAAEQWSAARLRAVLVHELGHVRRHDTLVQLAAQLACAIHWWNPLAWIAASRLRIEREHACDDLVLDAGTLPSSYAGDLLEVARDLSTISTDAHVGASCMVDHSSTETRLRRILDATAARRPLRTRFRIGAVGVTLACAVTLACTSSPPKLAPASEPPAPVATTRGTLSVGAPSVREPGVAAEQPGAPFLVDPIQPASKQGTLDLSLVATEVKHRIGALADCYERQLAATPTLAGTVEIHWVIAPSGTVMDACVTKDTVGNREITACVNKLVLEGGPFPAPSGGSVDVVFPFVFAPNPTVASTR
jgi:beta-lactamase regulating signal transducer with metallopeptidase domain